MECFRADVDIFCINESWLNSNIENDNMRWIGNQIFRIDRVANKSGGLVTYVCNDLASHTSTVEEHTFIKENIEVQTLLINKPMVRTKYICNIYRPPKGDHVEFFRELETIINDIDLANHDVWLGGDFNIDYNIKKETKCKALISFANELNLNILIDKITRPKDDSGTMIDNILSNADNIMFSKPLPIFISDHLPVLVVQKKQPTVLHESTFTGRSYRSYDKLDLEDVLLYYDWGPFYRETDPNKQWEELIGVTQKYLDENCPVQIFNIKSRDVEWITPEIREAIRDRHAAMSDFLENGQARDLREAKNLRSRVSVMIDESKKENIDQAYNIKNDGHFQFWQKSCILDV